MSNDGNPNVFDGGVESRRHAETGNKSGAVPEAEQSSSATSFVRASGPEDKTLNPRAGVASGPLIVDSRTGLPYHRKRFERIWRAVAGAAGIPAGIWNRDLRKSGSTEARRAGAAIDDVKKVMGHTAETDVTANVYDLATLEAFRRVSAARLAFREGEK